MPARLRQHVCRAHAEFVRLSLVRTSPLSDRHALAIADRYSLSYKQIYGSDVDDVEMDLILDHLAQAYTESG